MKVPRVSWLPRSRMKLAISRGPKFELAKETATIVIEKVVPATPTIEPAIAVNTALAPSVCVCPIRPKRLDELMLWHWSSEGITNDSTTAIEAMQLGRNQ